MPEELRDLLTERSKSNGRSLNAEILGILQDAIARPTTPPAIDVDALAEALAERLATKLKTP
jgi:hypothetical protein